MNNKILGIGIILLFFVLVLQLQIVSAAQCNDGVDNDLDGTIDYPADSGCDSATDLTEARRLGYESGCLTDGDKLMDIFGNINYACEHDTCNVCVLKTEIGNYTTLPSRCAGLEQCTFGSSGGGNGGGTGGGAAPTSKAGPAKEKKEDTIEYPEDDINPEDIPF